MRRHEAFIDGKQRLEWKRSLERQRKKSKMVKEKVRRDLDKQARGGHESADADTEGEGAGPGRARAKPAAGMAPAAAPPVGGGKARGTRGGAPPPLMSS